MPRRFLGISFAVLGLALLAVPSAGAASLYEVTVEAKLTQDWSLHGTGYCVPVGSGTSTITVETRRPFIAELRLRDGVLWDLLPAAGRRAIPRLLRLVGSSAMSGSIVMPPGDPDDPCPRAEQPCVGRPIKDAVPESSPGAGPAVRLHSRSQRAGVRGPAGTRQLFRGLHPQLLGPGCFRGSPAQHRRADGQARNARRSRGEAKGVHRRRPRSLALLEQRPHLRHAARASDHVSRSRAESPGAGAGLGPCPSSQDLKSRMDSAVGERRALRVADEAIAPVPMDQPREEHGAQVRSYVQAGRPLQTTGNCVRRPRPPRRDTPDSYYQGGTAGGEISNRARNSRRPGCRPLHQRGVGANAQPRDARVAAGSGFLDTARYMHAKLRPYRDASGSPRRTR